MSAAVQTPPPATSAILTAADFARRYAGQRVELVEGKVKELPVADFLHGKVCYRIALALGSHVEPLDLGHVMINDSWIKVARDPDTARGADVCFVSYSRLAKGKLKPGMQDAVPELVFEVRSPSDRWTDVVGKAIEYLTAGVTAVVILDPRTESAAVYRTDTRDDIFEKDETLVVPDVLPGFAVPVAEFFE